MMNCNPKYSAFLHSCVAVLLIPMQVPVLAQPQNEHAIFARYPSPRQLQAQVDRFKSKHSIEFSAARADFGVAVRSTLELDPPDPPGPPGSGIRHGGPLKPLLRGVETRAFWGSTIERWEQMEGGAEPAGFYRRHLDEISVEPCPALRMVCYDVLVNGWHDWRGWDSEQLAAIRGKVPDLHVTYALLLLRPHDQDQSYLDYKDALGVALRIVSDASYSKYSREWAAGLVQRLAEVQPSVELARYAADQVLSQEAQEPRLWFVSIAKWASERLPTPALRDLWADYLDCEDSSLRGQAAIFVGKSIRKAPLDQPEGRRDRELAERLRRMAQEDSSQWARRMAQHGVKQYEDSDKPPSRGITHHDGRK